MIRDRGWHDAVHQDVGAAFRLRHAGQLGVKLVHVQVVAAALALPANARTRVNTTSSSSPTVPISHWTGAPHHPPRTIRPHDTLQVGANNPLAVPYLGLQHKVGGRRKRRLDGGVCQRVAAGKALLGGRNSTRKLITLTDKKQVYGEAKRGE